MSSAWDSSLGCCIDALLCLRPSCLRLSDWGRLLEAISHLLKAVSIGHLIEVVSCFIAKIPRKANNIFNWIMNKYYLDYCKFSNQILLFSWSFARRSLMPQICDTKSMSIHRYLLTFGLGCEFCFPTHPEAFLCCIAKSLRKGQTEMFGWGWGHRFETSLHIFCWMFAWALSSLSPVVLNILTTTATLAWASSNRTRTKWPSKKKEKKREFNYNLEHVNVILNIKSQVYKLLWSWVRISTLLISRVQYISMKTYFYVWNMKVHKTSSHEI